ncbi:MAG TPA: F0F1 ATP synthase subunit B [Thermoguttaceae bacterium]|nr:F0F1 ATP synthase subunit B [Thermoguttaceae bacterium]
MMFKQFALRMAVGSAVAVFTTGMAQAAAHGETAATEAGPLYWQNDLAIYTALVFIVLLLVLWRFAWGPIADGLARREKGIAGQISEAEAANRDAKQLLIDYQQKLDAAGEEVRRLLTQGRRDAEQSARQIVDEARGQAKVEHQRALAEIDQATTGALSELAAKSAELAVGLAGKIVKAELRPGDHAELVNQAVADFTTGKKAK